MSNIIPLFKKQDPKKPVDVVAELRDNLQELKKLHNQLKQVLQEAGAIFHEDTDHE